MLFFDKAYGVYNAGFPFYGRFQLLGVLTNEVVKNKIGN